MDALAEMTSIGAVRREQPEKTSKQFAPQGKEREGKFRKNASRVARPFDTPPLTLQGMEISRPGKLSRTVDKKPNANLLEAPPVPRRIISNYSNFKYLASYLEP